MSNVEQPVSEKGRWLALTAALLGWMFDGLEMGLFPLVGRPALRELLPQASEGQIGKWFAVAMAIFLVGAATGGVLFGWLGDRIGRVRAMMLSVLTYALFTAFQGFVTHAWQIVPLRFVAALGMGGEWSLGVALVNEIWPGRSRAFLAGLIGAAANVGFLLIAIIGRSLSAWIVETQNLLMSVGLPEDWVADLTANRAWRLLLILGGVPALLTFFIRVFVPESERWERERGRGATSHWAARDLLGVGIGALGACGIIYLWADDRVPLPVQIAGTLVGLVIVTLGYIYPVYRYLQRAEIPRGQVSTAITDRPWEVSLARQGTSSPPSTAVSDRPLPPSREIVVHQDPLRGTMPRMLLGACLSGVALLGTWGSLQWAPTWADQLTGGQQFSREDTQIWSGIAAIIGTIAAAFLGDLLGRRLAYSLLCIGSLASAIFFFQWNTSYGPAFLVTVFIAGAFTASFYGWLPLYLPELFRTAVRATGQGFGFNFGRILAAIGALQTGNLMSALGGSYPQACTIMSLIYVVGIGIIWLAPETRGKPLPE